MTGLHEDVRKLNRPVIIPEHGMLDALFAIPIAVAGFGRGLLC